ncbi:non-ribosomal peptide synthetase [Chitinophaga qingshengii]|uniref:Amino acid adenylation domain-containing protein n=1 Tax=Chitinophaga qingshengii TaxID=1569794 RepID=A0ABR7TXU1_9BACT|nr:non-ribosomal peptide synthetase [Chitinophaga qingshengii]MBC9934893.1 amino acid adenylation domain-containing protein [Chitinophaga qingshengii]
MEKLIADLRKQQVRITLQDKQLRVLAAKDALSPDLMEALKRHKDDLISYIEKYPFAFDEQHRITAVEEQEHYPASDAQQRMWVLNLFEENQAAYNIPAVYTLSGSLHLAAFEKAFEEVVKRHESLRTTFLEVDGALRQQVLAGTDRTFRFSYVDLGAMTDTEALIQEMIAYETTFVFSLQHGPLLRCKLVKTGDARYVFLLNMHHIITDGWSVEVLLKEVLFFYNHHTSETGQPAPAPLSIQYRDYTIWKQHTLAALENSDDSRYWKEQLAGPVPVLELPADHIRPAIMSANGRQQWFTIDKDLSRALLELARKERVSRFVLFVATFKALFFRYTGQEDIIIGTPVANRNKEELEDQIGLYMNTMALRTRFNGKGGFRHLLEQVKNTVLDADKHQHYPFDKLLDDLQLKRDLSRSPLFDVMITVPAEATANTGHTATMQGLDISRYPGNTTTAQFDLAIDVVENDDAFDISIIYNADIFEDRRIAYFFGHYCQLIKNIVEEPVRPLDSLNYLSPEERHQLIFEFNRTALASPPEKSYLDFFYDQVIKNPDNIAVSCEQERLTYRQLDEYAGRLAHWLLAKGLQKGDFVPVLFERSVDTLAAILAIFKAGGAFILLDPLYPLKRIADLVADTGAAMLITKTSACADWSLFATSMQQETALRHIIFLDVPAVNAGVWPDTANTDLTATGTDVLQEQPAGNPSIAIQPDDISFVIYTSGSTGKPKGALNTQIGMVNHCLVMIDRFEIDSNSVIAQTAPPSFDISIWQLVTGAMAGANTVIYPQRQVHNPAALLRAMQQDNVTVVQWVPSYLTVVLEELAACPEEDFFPSLKYLILCGEVIRPGLIKEWFHFYPQVKVANAYGPAEASDDITLNIVSADTFDGRISIGRPVANCRIYILDEQLQLCPAGHIGEICVAGICVGAGYLNNPEKTAAVFLKDPFGEASHQMYRTGDLGMWRPDGTLEFIGRKDYQVKIRGQRVEPGEVETLLLREETVAQVVVLDVIDENQNNDLVAFLVPTDDRQFSVDNIKQRLEQQLPVFMIPSRFIRLARLPLTDNGKVDRKALKRKAVEGSLEQHETYIAPHNASEMLLQKLWQEVLGKESISIRSNFFDIGGHSLKAVRLISRIYKETGHRVELRELFFRNTIEKQAMLLSFAPAEDFAEIPLAPAGPHYPVSHAQKRIWLLEQSNETGAYNVPESFELSGTLNIDLFNKAFQYLIKRHECLRTTFITVDGEPRQLVHAVENYPFRIEVTDLRMAPDKEKQAAAMVDKEAWRPFSLEKGPLMYARLLRIEDERYIFLLTMHHIIADGWSTDIVSRDVMTAYNAYLSGNEPDLAPLRIQYKDYSVWQQHELTGTSYAGHREYWLSQFSEDAPVLALPTDAPRPAVKTYNGETASMNIDPPLKRELDQLARRQGCTMFMLMMAAVNTLYYRYTGQEDIVIGASASDRDHPDLEDQIGFFVNMLPIRQRFSGTNSFIELLKAVKDNVLGAFSHQVYPFDLLLEELRLDRDLSRMPLFDVVLTMQNTGLSDDAMQELQEVSIQTYDRKVKLAKFDVTLFFVEHEGGMELRVLYNTDLFHATRIENMLRHFRTMLEAIVKEPELPLKIIPLLLPAEHTSLLAFAAPPVPVKQRCLLTHEQITAQAALHPDATAVISASGRISYQHFNEEANRLAHHLRKQHQVKPGDIVGMMMDRSEKMIITLLAILKAGAAWLPMEPGWPAARKAAILEEALPVLLITESNYMFDLSYYSGALFITDIEWDGLPSEKSDPGNVNVPEDLAYVIYTSGSTGRPKGVMLPHRGLAAYLGWFEQTFHTGPGDSTLLLSSIAFDLGYTSLWGALTTGAAVVINNAGEYLDREEMITSMRNEAITFLKLTPSHLDILVNDPAFEEEARSLSLRLVITGGESIRTDDIEKLLHALPACTIANHYGPTETTIGTLAHVFDRNTFAAFKRMPVLGRPIAHNKVYLLDSALQPVPAGIPGEICVTGQGLALQYMHEPALTSEKFIPDPFEQDGRLYRTGDLGRYTAQGDVIFMGRKDNQVKIRGYRVETAEVETALMKHPAVRAALVLVIQEADRNRLVAYYQLSTPQDASDLKKYVEAALPDYMVPAHWIELDTFPLTANGKIDRKALPAPVPAEKAQIQAPASIVEEKLVEIWKEVLGYERISTLDNFFNIGGDSIKAIQVASRMSKAGYRIGVKDIFENPVLNQLALYARKVVKVADQSPVLGRVPLTPVQLRFLQSGYTKLHHYNQSLLFHPEGKWTGETLRQIFTKIQEHHDALRMTFRQDEAGNWIQENAGTDMPADCSVIDLCGDVTPSHTMLQHINDIQASMNLAAGPLMKAVLFRLPDGDRLLVAAHHLVMDGVSWRILEEDIHLLHEQYENQQPLSLPLKTDAYKLWAERLLAYAGTEECLQECDYWQRLFTQPLKPLPTDHYIISNLQEQRANVSFQIDERTTALLSGEVHRAFSTDINDILLTALVLALDKAFGIRQCLVALEGHGREEVFGDEIDITRTIGWFTNVYPVLLDISGSDELSRNIIAVKEHLHRLPDRGIRYGILKYLSAPEHRLQEMHQPEISFNYLGTFNSKLALAEEEPGRQTSGEWVAPYTLDVRGLILDKSLSVAIEYNTTQYDEVTMENLVQCYKHCLLEIIGLCMQQQQRVLSPVDLTYQHIAMDVLEQTAARYNIEDIYPLSPLQAGMMFLSEQHAEDAYYRQVYYELEGNLQEKHIAKTVHLLFLRHDMLRTMFSTRLADIPLQIVLKDREPEFVFRDLNDIPAAAQQEILEAYRTADKKRGFRLDADVLMRIAVFKLSANDFVIIWSYHHMIMDGWGTSVLISEFFELYNAMLQGVSPVLDTVMHYRNYIQWLEKQNRPAALAHWQHYLAGYNELATLPAWQHATAGTYEQGSLQSIVPAAVSRSLVALAAQTNVTLSTVLQAAWGLLLGIYNNRGDVVFGAVVSGRPENIPGIESMVGLFVNTIPVRVNTSGVDTFADLLSAMQRDTAANTPYHYCQLAEIQSATGLRDQLLDHILVFENYPIAEKVDSYVQGINERDSGVAHFKVNGLKYEERSHYNFYIIITPGESIAIQFGFNNLYYDSRLIAQLAAHFLYLLEQLAMHPDQLLEHLQVLSSEEQLRLVTGTDTRLEYDSTATIVSLFENVATATPHAVAVRGGQDTLTYAALNSAANKLAYHLRRGKGIRPGDLVGVMTDRSVYMAISILAVLKAGGAYVPIDPAYPLQRKEYILADTGMQYLLTDGSYVVNSDMLKEILSVPALLQELDGLAGDNPDQVNTPDDLAYIIYTSGSTGQPNGVMIPHRGSVNMFASQRHYFRLTPADNVLQFSSFSFDASVWECMMALLSGATLVMVDRNVIEDPARFTAYVTAQQVTILTLPPVYLSMLDRQQLKTVRLLITAGEEARLQDAIACSQEMDYWNAYGPSECAVCAAMYQVSPADAGRPRVPIGKAIGNTKILIMDNSMKLAPPGVTGEICVAGDGVGLGYWRRETLTAGKFVQVNGERLYRTGDLGRWLPDGNLEFLGRADDQVKIRGHRIETGEVMNTIRKHPAVQDAYVTTGMYPEKCLVAYYTSNTHISRESLLDYLRDMLPAFMIPAYMTQLDKLPLTPNGKIDKQALPDPVAATAAMPETPLTRQEALLVDVWEKVLGRKGIGAGDNFYQVGGDSIKAMQIAARLHRMEYEATAQDVLRYPVLSALASHLKKREHQAEQSSVTGNVPLTPVQHWFSAHRGPRHHFNQSITLRFKERTDHMALQQALALLQLHHDALRMTFSFTDDHMGQWNAGQDHPHFWQVHDLREAASPPEEMAVLTDQYQQSLDLGTGPLMKPVLFVMPDADHLLVVMHHLVTDGVSWRILLEDIHTLYERLKGGQEPLLPAKTHSYKHWAEALTAYAVTPAMLTELDYWKQVQQNVPAVKAHGGGLLEEYDLLYFESDSKTTTALLTAANATFLTEANELILAALAKAAGDVLHMPELGLSIEGHGREEIVAGIDLSRTVGWFTSLYPLLLNTGGDLRTVIVNTKDTLRKVPQKGIGYGILRYLTPAASKAGTDFHRHPAISYNYLGSFDEAGGNGTFEVTGMEGRNFSHEWEWDFALSVSVYIKDGRLLVSFAYNTGVFEENVIRSLGDTMVACLRDIVHCCISQEQSPVSLLDMTFKDLTISDHDLDILRKGLH